MDSLIERLEAIESMLNEDTPNISDIRIDLGLLLEDLTNDTPERSAIWDNIYSNMWYKSHY